ncbi:hypothetical protein LJE71_04485 [Xanthobacter autotrophicus]|uniref:hypothetical protein n=1 Tax=Xanthobacter autotrophicus TaxID=280 RepID=UPI001E5CE5C4|nr:hypothetical protein [Xanthobacter autotrophicus]UDQ90274.1 hypothetical protein LJE71_04485 [Xanthobacter autotrophicus]
MAERLERARSSLAQDKTTKGMLYFTLSDLSALFSQFISHDRAFNISKHNAKEIISSIEYIYKNMLGMEDGDFNYSEFNFTVEKWQYSYLQSKLDSFKIVFQAECNDAAIYFVDQVLIYNTSALVENAFDRIHDEIRNILPSGIKIEFEQAGKALAFELWTACGFHSLRALELMMDHYLKEYNVELKHSTWHHYIYSMTKLSEDMERTEKPSKKVVAMLDRMREIDRNPLMHPQDTLDCTQAETLFSLSTITIVEMARDLKTKSATLSQGTLPLIPSPDGRVGTDLTVGDTGIDA